MATYIALANFTDQGIRQSGYQRALCLGTAC
jgi:uncharacterized protein with GYD domain